MLKNIKASLLSRNQGYIWLGIWVLFSVCLLGSALIAGLRVLLH